MWMKDRAVKNYRRLLDLLLVVAMSCVLDIAVLILDMFVSGGNLTL